MRRAATVLLVLGVAVSPWACTPNFTADVGSVPEGADGSGDGDNVSGGTGGAQGTLATTPLRRLTSSQYQNSLTAVFGAKLTPPALPITDLSVAGSTGAGSSQVAMPMVDAEAFTQAAYTVAAQIASPAMRAQLPCQPRNAADADCAATIIKTYGDLLYRRPLTAAQRAAYAAVANKEALASDDFYVGIQAALATMLQSPYFLFRADKAQAAPGDVGAWDAYTLAARLSYLIWDSSPDAALLAAARDNSLLQTATLQAQTDRLLADPKSDAALMHFVGEMLQLHGIATAQKDPNIYTPALAADLTTQAQRTLSDLLLANNGDYRDLFTSEDVYVNAALAKRYGYPTATGTDFTKVRFGGDDRAGLFGLPGIMAMLSPSNRSSPTMRGLYIRETLLCAPIASPPATVNTTVTSSAKNPRTMRQIMSGHASDPECAGCHNQMDPLGFALDGFDWLGMHRTTDSNLPLDLSGTVNGRAFTDARSFGVALHDDPSITTCATKRFLLHAAGVNYRLSDEAVTKLWADFSASGFRLKGLVRAYVLSDAFKRVPTVATPIAEG